MTFTVKNTDYNPTFDESYFEVNSIINGANKETSDPNKENNKQNNYQSNNDNKENSNNNNENNSSTDKNNNSNQETDNKTTNTTSACDPKIDSTCKIDDNNNAKQENNNYVNIPATRLTMTMNGDEDLVQTIKEDTTKKTTKTASLEDVIYPLYLPTGTVLKDQEKVSKTDGERVILTFSGDKGFTLVEETALRENEFTIIPTYGEPGFVNDTVGAITDNSLNWISNGVEYYMVSDVMNTVELLDIANSINVTAVASLK